MAIQAVQFSAMPLEILANRGLSRATLTVAGALLYFGRNGNLRVKVSTLATSTGYSCRSVHRALKELKDAGLLAWNRTGRSSRYWVKGVLLELVTQITKTLLSGVRRYRWMFVRYDTPGRNTEEKLNTTSAARPEGTL